MSKHAEAVVPRAMEHDVPEIMEAALVFLSHELERVMSNIGGEHFDDPFSNSGASYRNDTFEVAAYDWDDNSEQWYNFAWRNVRISWYKYLGRGLKANVAISPDIASACLVDCMAALRKLVDEHDAAERAAWSKEGGAA